jgi:hypothetical protein
VRCLTLSVELKLQVFENEVHRNYNEKQKRRSNSNIVLRETGCEDRRWMELPHSRVQLQALVLSVLNQRVSYGFHNSTYRVDVTFHGNRVVI